MCVSSRVGGHRGGPNPVLDGVSPWKGNGGSFPTRAVKTIADIFSMFHVVLVLFCDHPEFRTGTLTKKPVSVLIAEKLTGMPGAFIPQIRVTVPRRVQFFPAESLT